MGEIAVAVHADPHVGKRTPTYDVDIFRACLSRHTRKLLRFSVLLAEHDIEELVLLPLGDVTDGGGIYRTQVYAQDVTDPDEQGRIWAETVAAQAQELRQAYPKVSILPVCGNHGRRGKDANPRANSDLNGYHFLAEKLRATDIPVHLPDKDENPNMRLWTAKGHKYLLYHGDGGALAWVGIERRILRLNATRQYRGFDVALQGHTHRSWHLPINDIASFGAGTLVTGDDYVMRSGLEESPVWWFFGISSEHPVTWVYGLDCVHG